MTQASHECDGSPEDDSLAGFPSLDAMLEKYLPADKLREARRVLYGALLAYDCAHRVCPAREAGQ